MVSSPEEYFNTQDFSPTSSHTEYTPAERLFMMKYLGLNDEDLLNKKLKSAELPKPDAPPAAQATLADSEYINDIAFDTKESAEQEPPTGAAFIQKAVEPEAKLEQAQLPVASAEADEDEKPADINDAQTPPTAIAPEADRISNASIAEASSTGTASVQPQADSMVTAPTAAAVEVKAETQTQTDEVVKPQVGTSGETLLTDAEPDAASGVVSSPPLAAQVASAEQIRSPLDITREEFEAVKAAEPALESVLKQEEHCQMVAFFIGDQEFVIPTMAMQEVIRFETPIRIPMAPPFVEGVISLRGRVTPVVNLRNMLDVVNKPLETSKKCIIICLRRGIQLGFVVEKIHTMYWVAQSNLEWGVEAQLGINSDVDFISAVMKSEDGMRLLGMISVDKIIDSILR